MVREQPSDASEVLNDRGHLAADLLDQLELGMLTPQQRGAVIAHLQDCAACAEKHAKLQADMQHFRAQVAPKTAARVAGGVRAKRWRSIGTWILAPTLAAAAAIALVTLRPGRVGDDLRIKGEPAVRIVAKRREAVFPVEDGTVLAPGDRIQFLLTPAGSTHLLVAFRDASGVVGLYASHKGGSVELAPEQRALPGSVELDETLGRELIVFVFSRERLAADTVTGILKARGTVTPAELSRPAHVVTREIVKAAP